MTAPEEDPRVLAVCDEFGMVSEEAVARDAYVATHQVAAATTDDEVRQILRDWHGQYHENDQVYAELLVLLIRNMASLIVAPVLDAVEPLMPTVRADLARVRDEVMKTLGGGAA